MYGIVLWNDKQNQLRSHYLKKTFVHLLTKRFFYRHYKLK